MDPGIGALLKKYSDGFRYHDERMAIMGAWLTAYDKTLAA